ncbi:MAG: hypothetical protein IMW98_07675 [Firmicutes bacterium]|nr:hypothetical protein [Bacillota bacterium]
MRDYLDVAALARRIRTERAARVLARLDEFYEADGGTMADHRPVATQLMKQLAEPRPVDGHATDLHGFRSIEPTLSSWEAVTEQTRAVAAAMAALLGVADLEEDGE